MIEARGWGFGSVAAVAIAGMGFASFAKEAQTAVLIGGFASSICVSLLTYLKTHRVEEKTDAIGAKTDAIGTKADKAVENASVAAGKAEETANLVQENAAHNDERLEMLTRSTLENKKTGQAIYGLVNSQSGKQLGIYAVMARRMANTSAAAGDPRAEDDARIADQAEKDYLEHEQKQRRVDDAGEAPQHG